MLCLRCFLHVIILSVLGVFFDMSGRAPVRWIRNILIRKCFEAWQALFKVKELLKNIVKVCDSSKIWPLRHTLPRTLCLHVLCLWKGKDDYTLSRCSWWRLTCLSVPLSLFPPLLLPDYLFVHPLSLHRSLLRHLLFSALLCFPLRPEPPRRAPAGYNNLEVAEYLLEHGADVNAQDKGGLIPLHNAASYGVRHTSCRPEISSQVILMSFLLWYLFIVYRF